MCDDVQIPLQEYTEAGKTCRWYEHLRRRNLFLLIAFQSAVLGFIQYRGAQRLESIPLELFGLYVAFVCMNAEFRISDYYRSYILRAKELEKQLGMALYTQGWRDIQNSNTFPLRIGFPLIPFVLTVLLVGLMAFQLHTALGVWASIPSFVLAAFLSATTYWFYHCVQGKPRRGEGSESQN